MRTRFAPSPTGPLHLGHAYSALLAHDMAMEHGGEFLLRIEDIDQSRCRPEWEEQIYDDLRWLGIHWETPVLRQSDRGAAYDVTLDELWERDRIYPCHCSRRDVAEAASAPQEGAPLFGPDGVVYPGTCRITHASTLGSRPKSSTLRLNMKLAAAWTGDSHVGSDLYYFCEEGHGPNGENGWINFTAEDLIEGVGDIVIARQNMGTSYHLSVVLDDAAQGITHVIRGEDLFEATKIHVILQRLLGLPTPAYHHHRLIRDDTGKRLAKRDDARAIAKYRADGATPEDIRRLVGL
ncbi:tRNA glutamyl-Q(34) synthetase GluQRS [Shimia sp. FJ5]|uniref:tRNA glutamyl-Q(34) synthetase GluQRS n=1 Tax=Shimia sp. FJ5 TaxID=3079054 RepID=UPI00260E1FEA|nr:tRNA glutamyl-Q(34) synthetase GluQRS [Shimia sp. FJ5]MDV4144105.1 tRNA glutamyl-Q(34) synthetase GluQRS [Shimia sp. FJ5]